MADTVTSFAGHRWFGDIELQRYAEEFPVAIAAVKFRIAMPWHRTFTDRHHPVQA